ncbi:GPI transamidase component PIG-S isoform X2 [Parasteatoda tepidariorum]|uniref:GPI transamidase component PIG-S isoform X2 n=1 Tax=Parasteatoda tepidariorum TaxID=114398 RepID=UPI001C72161A|nr:GPI transamidase component PIG-S isoform X2 [Parasteatoda tepidariorum]
MDKSNLDVNTVITTSVYILTFIFIGIPLWWKTTEVYRYPIPHNDCQNLQSEMVGHTIFVKILLDDREVQQGLFWEELLKLGSLKNEETSQPVFNFQWSMSITSNEEAAIIKESENITKLNDVLVFNERSSYKKPEGELTIVILRKHFMDCPRFVIGSKRHGFVLNNGGDSKKLASDVMLLVNKIVQVERLQKLFTPASSYIADKNPDKDRMRYLKAMKSFDLTFSLIVPEPHVFEVNWDIENAIEEYMKNVIDELKDVVTIKIKSQVLFMTSLPISAHLPMNAEKEFILQPEQLPSLVNPIEDKLGSDTSLQPNVNFVLYIPSRHQSLLRISDSEGKALPSNAFLLPQWGGFMIYNPYLPENSSLPYTLHIDMSSVMNVFLSQFRLLLGLLNVGDLNNESFLELTGPIIREWEKDFLLRKNVQEQISSSMSSLSSLSHLLRKIRNIVIHDDIGQKVQFALSSTKESLQLLHHGYLKEGYKAAQVAFIDSDEAFYDPSLLRLLYFPEDQKYAIYIPLFLPISIPVLMSLTYLWKFWNELKHKSKHD